VGAGTKNEDRKITFWAEGGARFNGSMKIDKGLAVTGSLTATGASGEDRRALPVPIAEETLRFAAWGS
jgi:hypothetical protein